ncbi:MAG: ribbon-helix-helix domain-containing protein [Actinobacteria bacterium]|nr:ribbon-helix-helix domain-containing protein [Actinomycetota bacterium]
MPRSVPAMKKAQGSKAVSRKAVPRKTTKKAAARTSHSDALPDDVDATTIERLVDEAERGISERKLRGRGRPPIGAEASTAYSVRLPDELVVLVDERSAMDGVARGETIRRALIEYLTK